MRRGVHHASRSARRLSSSFWITCPLASHLGTQASFQVFPSAVTRSVLLPAPLHLPASAAITVTCSGANTGGRVSCEVTRRTKQASIITPAKQETKLLSAAATDQVSSTVGDSLSAEQIPAAEGTVPSISDSGVVAAAPQLPLCLRPAVHVELLAAAMAWRDHMAGRIVQLGDSLEQQDGGPGMAGLMRELDWVLDDVIEAVRVSPHSPWEETKWRLLEPRVKAAEHRQQNPRATWQLRLREPVSQLWEWWEQRLQDRVPFQYLISAAHWHRYVLSVGPGLLIPRPETEIFPELVRTAISARPYLAALPWADLGTGSGAIAIAAADELRQNNPAAEVWAVDVSPVAIAYALFNARLCLHTGAYAPKLHNGSANTAGPIVHVVQGSWFEPLHHLRGVLGGVLSNPPYIPRAQMRSLQAEVGRHEPIGALDGGEGPGLDSLQALCSEAAAMLAPGGLIALETAGGEQADLVADILRTARVPAPDSSHVSTTDRMSGSKSSSSTTGKDGAAGAAGAATPGWLMREGTSEDWGWGEDSGRKDITNLGRAAFTYGSETMMAGAAFEEVEVLEDCYGVHRFVRAYRRGGGCCISAG
ncbi:hypothetical protein VaNZ11_011518 [Volvox africanus]|uniref:Methyltransferase small domain-containing protein n=1 Tax=Volvox africanus TaxID=51714 RepID=A0ABQ5SBQ3_9CHLO|nr:hypothetical protein VaNZ11_011518 [Volvox africanus]